MLGLLLFDFFSSNTAKILNIIILQDDTEFTVPSYPSRLNEPEDALRARLTYQSRKRGIAENCLILRFTYNYYYFNFFEQQVFLFFHFQSIQFINYLPTLKIFGRWQVP